MKQLYLPAILPTTLYDKWGLSPMNWLDPQTQGTGAYYPYVLISFYHWRTTRKIFTPDVHVFGDSGGYSDCALRLLHWVPDTRASRQCPGPSQ